MEISTRKNRLQNSSSEREDVISQIKKEVTTLTESVGESDDVPQTSSGIQQTKGENKLMKLLGVVQGSTEDQHLTITPFKKAE